MLEAELIMVTVHFVLLNTRALVIDSDSWSLQPEKLWQKYKLPWIRIQMRISQREFQDTGLLSIEKLSDLADSLIRESDTGKTM